MLINTEKDLLVSDVVDKASSSGWSLDDIMGGTATSPFFDLVLQEQLPCFWFPTGSCSLTLDARGYIPTSMSLSKSDCVLRQYKSSDVVLFDSLLLFQRSALPTTRSLPPFTRLPPRPFPKLRRISYRQPSIFVEHNMMIW